MLFLSLDSIPSYSLRSKFPEHKAEEIEIWAKFEPHYAASEKATEFVFPTVVVVLDNSHTMRHTRSAEGAQ